jgi:hypothetical protein
MTKSPRQFVDMIVAYSWLKCEDERASLHSRPAPSCERVKMHEACMPASYYYLSVTGYIRALFFHSSPS